MSDYYIAVPYDDYVVHHGVLGMKLGVRRYQNVDGSLTLEGKKKYTHSEKRLLNKPIKTQKNLPEQKCITVKVLETDEN